MKYCPRCQIIQNVRINFVDLIDATVRQFYCEVFGIFLDDEKEEKNQVVRWKLERV